MAEPEIVETEYTVGEALALMAPFLGRDPGDLDGFILIGVNLCTETACIGGTSNIPQAAVPVILRSMAAQISTDT